MSEFVKIRPYQEKDWEELKRNAEADQHSGVYCPTEVSVKGGEIVGYMSIGAIPIMLTWQDRKKVNIVDSALSLGYVQGALRQFKHICVPCDPESPYHTTGFLKKAGFIEYTKQVVLYIKV